MPETPSLSKVQRQMLATSFFIDGWTNRYFLSDAQQLVGLGYLTMREGGDEQYTVYRYTPTPAGLELSKTLAAEAAP